MISTFSVVGKTKHFRISSVDPLVLHGLENFRQPDSAGSPAVAS
jgi:hypothetical protein